MIDQFLSCVYQAHIRPHRYRVNNKAILQEFKTSPFSIAQDQAGDFVVTSIAHQHKKCKTAVTDLRYVVHPLPFAQVGHGKRIIQDIHEGKLYLNGIVPYGR